MTVYEEKINQRIKEYNWQGMCELMTFEGTEELTSKILDAIFQDFRRPLDANCRRALDRYYTYDKDGIHYNGGYKKTIYGLSEMKMPCVDCNTHLSGLYFVGMIGVTPDDHKYYCVKVGMADDIANRIMTYVRHNPMIYHNNIYITNKESDSLSETRCHEYIAERAYSVAQNTEEWFYVDEETYFDLCSTFADKEMFKAIAEGRD